MQGCWWKTGRHAVVVVGYGLKKKWWWWEKDTPYWIIQNSWGVTWGNHGYMKIRRGRNEYDIETGAKYVRAHVGGPNPGGSPLCFEDDSMQNKDEIEFIRHQMPSEFKGECVDTGVEWP